MNDPVAWWQAMVSNILEYALSIATESTHAWAVRELHIRVYSIDTIDHQVDTSPPRNNLPGAKRLVEGFAFRGANQISE